MTVEELHNKQAEELWPNEYRSIGVEPFLLLRSAPERGNGTHNIWPPECTVEVVKGSSYAD